MKSHYFRQSTDRDYLNHDLNITILYSRYKDSCVYPAVKLSYYRALFNSKFNYAFNKPKKDLCDLCVEYRMCLDYNITIEDRLTEKYNTHTHTHTHQGETENVICFYVR